MRYTTLILLCLCITAFCAAQTPAELRKIKKFKNSLMRRATLDKPDSLFLDTVILVRVKEKNSRLVNTIFKNQNRILRENFFDRSTRIKSISETDIHGRPFGMERNFTEDGSLDYTYNYDTGEWIVNDTANYPYYKLQTAIKAKADSLISKMYGPSFLIKHTTWSLYGSYINIGREKLRWDRKLNSVPTRFEFCYKVSLDSLKEYQSYIYFDLDEKGNFLPSSDERGFFYNGYGFENVPEIHKGSFRFNYMDALERARSMGLTETDSTRAFGGLHWERFKKRDIINGQYRFYISIETAKVRKPAVNGRSFQTTKYDIYSFSPWSGEFIELKKMKIDQWWEKDRSGWSELSPDTE